MGKKLRMYGIKFGGGLINSDNFSKILEYSSGDARRFARNVINIRMGNHKFNLDGGIKDITTYFADTNMIRDAIVKQIDKVINDITDKLTNTGGEEGQEILSEERRQKLISAQNKLIDGRNHIKKVSGYDENTCVEENNNFNADFIQNGKFKIAEGLKEAAASLINTSVDGTETSAVSNSFQKMINKRCNHLRKIACEKYEEKYSAELYVKGVNKYKYANTWEELIEWVQTTMKDLGCSMKITAKKYATPEALETALKEYFDTNNIEYKSIEIESITNISDTEADEMEALNGDGE